MTPNLQSRRRFHLVLTVVVGSAVAGALYGLAVSAGAPKAGMMRGAVTGALISLALTLIEIGIIERSAGMPLRRGPFGLLLAVRTLVYVAVIVLGLIAGEIVVPIPGDEGFGVRARDWVTVAISLVVAFTVTLLLAVSRVLGRGVLPNLLLGRYHQPRPEDRIFLLLDLRDSTGIAERIGDLAFHRLMNRVFFDLTGPIVEARGDIHKYVGDEMIVTWHLEDGARDARCIRAAFAAAAELERRAPDYQREFGVMPAFRAAVHCGRVVSGELGDVKREIGFVGSTLNVAARIEEEARRRDVFFLASAPLLRHMSLPAEIAAASIGPVSIRGSDTPIELFRLSAAGVNS